MFDKISRPFQSPDPRHGSGPAASGDVRRPGADEPPAYAALDLGTNNCRLLVARPVAALAEGGFRPAIGSGFEVIDAFSRIVRLGEGLDRSGTLSRAAMDRTVDALKVCAAKIRRRRVLFARHVATEACRRAGNCIEFLERVRWETGLRFEIISSAEEASLALAGCATLLSAAQPHAVVFDIGGGSTELMWASLRNPAADTSGHDVPPNCAPPNGAPLGGAPSGGAPSAGSGADLLDSISLPFGVINLSESFGGDRVMPEDFERMVDLVRAPMAAFDARHGIRARIAAGGVQMLGTSGTVTTLAGIRLGLPCYDRSKVDGCYLDFAEVQEVTGRLLALDCKGRAEQPCIGPSRADLVLAGCAILAAICRTWPTGRLRVADRGVREGILFNLMRPSVVAGIPATP